MEQQQYTIQILDRDESTDLVTSKQSCLIGRSLISDIRIHLPSVKEMHLEIDMKNMRVTSYGNDVKVNDVEVEVNGTVNYEYGDVISLRNKRFVVHKNKEHREGKGLPLVVPAEKAFGEQTQPSTTPLMSLSRPCGSVVAAPALYKESTDVVDDTDGREIRDQSLTDREEVAPSKEDPGKNTRPSFFNATDSSIDSIIAREKEHVDGEIRSNIEFDVNVLQTSVIAKNTKPMDLKEAVLEKTVLVDIMEGMQDAQEAERAVCDLSEKGGVHGEIYKGAQVSVDHIEEGKVDEPEGSSADTAESTLRNVVKIRKEVLLVTERTVFTHKDTPYESVIDVSVTPQETTESKSYEAPQASKEVLLMDGMDEVLGKQEIIKADTFTECAGESHLSDLESVEEVVPAGEGDAEGKNGTAEENTKRRSVNNNLDVEPLKEESEMAGTKYSSANRRVVNLVDSLNKEEERRANTGVLAKKAKSADSVSTKGEIPQMKIASTHKKEEEPAVESKKSAYIETDMAKKDERMSLPRKKADSRKKEPTSSRKSKEQEITDEPFKKKVRLASAASSKKTADTPSKSRRRAAVPEKASKSKKQATTKKEALKKVPATPMKKRVSEDSEKKKTKK